MKTQPSFHPCFNSNNAHLRWAYRCSQYTIVMMFETYSNKDHSSIFWSKLKLQVNCFPFYFKNNLKIHTYMKKPGAVFLWVRWVLRKTCRFAIFGRAHFYFIFNREDSLISGHAHPFITLPHTLFRELPILHWASQGTST